MENVSVLRERIDSLKADLRSVRDSLEAAEASLAESEAALDAAAAAQDIAQSVALQMQRTAHARLEDIATTCLRTVFSPEYSLTINFERKRGRTEAGLVLKRGDVVIEDPQSACGGGVVDVISLSLRLAAIQLSRPARRRVLILDEPMRFLSAEYRPGIRDLLEKLSEQVQIIMVTHIEDLEIGNIIRLER